MQDVTKPVHLKVR